MSVRSLDLYFISTSDLYQIAKLGARHQVLGGLIDMGTSTWVRVDEQGQSIASLLQKVCEENPGCVLHMLDSEWNQQSSLLRATLECKVFISPVLVVVTDFRGSGTGFMIVAGPNLPCMGAVPQCNAACFYATVQFLLGQTGMDTETIYTDGQAQTVDAFDDVSKRLRKLYGE